MLLNKTLCGTLMPTFCGITQCVEHVFIEKIHKIKMKFPLLEILIVSGRMLNKIIHTTI